MTLRRGFCQHCGQVKQEKLPRGAAHAFYTKRVVLCGGRRCRASPLQEVAQELALDGKTGKELDKQDRREQLRRAGRPRPQGSGSDEVAIKKGHTYRIVVSDLVRRRPLWCGGKERSEKSREECYQGLGPKKGQQMRWAGMDMGRACRASPLKPDHAPHAAILFDKFPGRRPLGAALDKVSKTASARLRGQERAEVKGQKYPVLSHRKNLSLDGRKALTKLLAANNRLHPAYLLKESFGQLWDYKKAGGARKFFEHWPAALQWQRRKPYDDFAERIERPWEGSAAHGKPENKVARGFVEGLNNKLRVLQRRAYGLRDEEYLRLKILTCMLPEI